MNNYVNTLIHVASDCPKYRGTPPFSSRKSPTIVELYYELLTREPYKFTYSQLLEEVHINRRGRSELKLDTYTLQRSRLCKEYGWGIHGDEFGRLALVGCETQKYKQLRRDPRIKKVNCSRRSK